MFDQTNNGQQQAQNNGPQSFGQPLSTPQIDGLLAATTPTDPMSQFPTSLPVAPLQNTDFAGSPTTLPTSSPILPNDPIQPPADNDLISIKQDALAHLSPLVNHLEQTPEEKFRTTMMMIQASDNQELIKPAFEAAKEITDDKARAQALLDVINEINYFTQQKV